MWASCPRGVSAAAASASANGSMSLASATQPMSAVMNVSMPPQRVTTTGRLRSIASSAAFDMPS